MLISYNPLGLLGAFIPSSKKVRARVLKQVSSLSLVFALCPQLIQAQVPEAPKASTLLKSAQLSQGPKSRGNLVRGIINREELNSALKGGVPHLLAQARLIPARKAGRFYGFKLQELRPSSLAERAGFRVGDVIMSVNDEPIGRPEQMMHVLSLLPFAESLVIRFERDTVTKDWTWMIRD